MSMFANLKSGELMALAGLILLVVHKTMRRQLLKSPGPVKGLRLFWLQWGDLTVFLIILGGLTLMYAQK